MNPLGIRLVVATGPGRLRLLPPKRFEGGREVVEAGQPLARVEQGGTVTLLRAPVTGTVHAVLGLEGEPVRAGQPVLAIDIQEDR